MYVNNRLSEISFHLQRLTSPEFSGQVEHAVEKKDKNLLIKICKKAKVPNDYIGSIVSVVMSVSPMKWPESF